MRRHARSRSNTDARPLSAATASSCPCRRPTGSPSDVVPSCCGSLSLLPCRTRPGDSRSSSLQSIGSQTFALCVHAARRASIRARVRPRAWLGTAHRPLRLRRNSRWSFALSHGTPRFRATVRRALPARRPWFRRPLRAARRYRLLRPPADPPRMTSGRVVPSSMPPPGLFRKERSGLAAAGCSIPECQSMSRGLVPTSDRAMIEGPALSVACLRTDDRNP
jgi:hypothetical protein